MGRRGIGPVVKDFRRELLEAQIWVVDDGSTVDTIPLHFCDIS
jgi:hypothetical protein